MSNKANKDTFFKKKWCGRTPRNSRYNSAVLQELPGNILFALGGRFRGRLFKYS
jgi:hypothetical protein